MNEVWPSIEAGLNFLVKGFTSNGIEQLLWHITAVEAVFDDDTKKNVTERLINRIANSLGSGAEDREKLKDRFRRLYTYRSNLVHGSIGRNSVKEGHLSEARDLVREAIFWSLQFWVHVSRQLPGALDGLTRRQVLTLIDRPSDEWERLIPVLRTFLNRFDVFRKPGYSD